MASILMYMAFAPPVHGQNDEELARSWCSGCHLFPAPELLGRKTWADTVLPNMGARLGVKGYGGRLYHADPVAPDGVYAAEPLIDAEEWGRIVSWYENNAPDQLTLPKLPAQAPLTLFEIETPSRDLHEFPTSTAIFIDEVSQSLLVGDGYELDLEVYATDLTLLTEIGSGGVISRLARVSSDQLIATTMGGSIGQSEQPLGLLIEFKGPPGTAGAASVKRLVRRLHRPVDVAFGDFNSDAKRDYVIAEFGTHTGKLSLHHGDADGTLAETVLIDEPGAIAVSIDGDDLFALLAQGDERIVRIKNFAQGQPSPPETLVRFPPSQGSSHMNTLDFNGDGITDLLYVAGDNADISPTYKPYHGVYLFLGRPDGSFRQDHFYHLDGATAAVAEDFDLDGDIDVAVIAYYANIERDANAAGFMYLENRDGAFLARSIAGLGKLGRFIAISAGDLDGDGDKDIALANMAFGPYGPMDVSPELQETWLSGPAFVLLRNGLR